MNTATSGGVTRRGFLGLAGAALAAPALAACNVSGNSGTNSAAGGGGSLKFWDMPWGQPAYNDAGKKLIEAYAPAGELPKASYQIIQWSNFYQTFSSAIASGSGPAVSSGAGFQAFQFAEQGAIAYADNLIDALKKDGTYDDFLPNVVDSMKTNAGYVAIPWQLDMRVLWYNKAILDQAGLKLPTTWDELLTAGKALRKLGISGFAIGSGAGNPMGSHIMVAMMINNGGGLFNPDGKPDCVTDVNVEAIEFLLELVNEGIIDKGSVSFTIDNVNALWNNGKAAIGFYSPGLTAAAPKTAANLVVADPLTAPRGGKGAVNFVNNLMMYKDTPSQQGSEEFLHYYLRNLHTYWDTKVASSIPVLKSITDSPAFSADPNNAKIVKVWQPISKNYAATGSTLFAGLAAVDGGQALSQFTQTILRGGTDARSALTTLQKGIEAVVQ